MTKPWHLKRRTFLRGAGASLALPFLECMGEDAKTQATPNRFCGVYFPYGITLTKADSEYSKWNWFPEGEGRDYKLLESLKSLEPLRDDMTIIKGMSHPQGRRMGGHDTADIWLTGVELKGSQLKNSVSLDQVIAQHYRDETRFSSLVLSTDGGVGEPTRSSTLSFSRSGKPIPALNKPRVVFDRLFGVSPDSLAAQRRELVNSGSMLDLVFEHSKTVRGKLGKQDQEKFDDYLDSVRQIEQRVERSERWLDIPKPKVDATGLSLDADDKTPAELIKTMYDLMYLAFQTDSTRAATYQIGNMNGATSIAGKFPQLLGIGKNMHGLAHGAGKGEGAKNQGLWGQFLAEQLTYFLDRLKSTQEGEGNLLDHTVVLYGSSNSNTHRNENYPVLVAGGRGIGFKHGQFIHGSKDVPLCNLYASMLNRMGVTDKGFSDSDGEMEI